MQSSSTTTRTFFNQSQFHKNSNGLTSYIFKQDQNDHHLSILLEMLAQFNSLVQLQEIEQGKQRCTRLVKQIGKVDQMHRSYERVRSLVNGSVILVLLAEGDVGKIQGLVDQEQDICFGINSPEYIGKVYLLRILILLIKSKHQQQPKSAQTHHEIKKYYKKFQKIKFNSTDTYCDTRLWQSTKLIEILVYQYILLVQKLAQYDEYKSYFLYKRGLNIAKRLLGRDHRFAKMMGKIMKIRRQTNKLVRLEPLSSSSIISSLTIKSKPKSLLHKKLDKILNPEVSNSQRYSKIYTQQSYSITKSKLIKSDYSQTKKPQNSKRFYTQQQQIPKKVSKIYQQQPKIQSNFQLQTLLHKKIGNNTQQISSMLSKIGSKANSKVSNQVYISIKRQQVQKEQENRGNIIYIEQNQIELDNNVGQGHKGQNGNQWNCQLI